MELRIWTKKQCNGIIIIPSTCDCIAQLWYNIITVWHEFFFVVSNLLLFQMNKFSQFDFFFKLLLKTNFGRSWYNCYLVFHVNYFSIPMLECSVPFYTCLNIHIQTHLQRYVTYMIHLRILTASLSALMLSENISWCWFSQSIRRLHLLHFLVYFLLHFFTQSILFCSEA